MQERRIGMNERVKELRKTLDLTMEKFGEKLGVGKTAISKIEKGENNLSDQMFKSICREFNVNEEWLRTGEGGNDNMFKSNSTLDKLASDYGLTNHDYVFLEKLLKNRKFLSSLEDFCIDYGRAMDSQNTARPSAIIPVRLISYYYKNASAGSGQLIIDSLPEKNIEIPDIPEYKDASYAIGVNGSSMEPAYHDGDILLVEATQEIKIGEIGIFQLDNECYVKKLGEDELISLNSEYENIPLNESAKIMGKVIASIQQ